MIEVDDIKIKDETSAPSIRDIAITLAKEFGDEIRGEDFCPLNGDGTTQLIKRDAHYYVFDRKDVRILYGELPHETISILQKGSLVYKFSNNGTLKEKTCLSEELRERLYRYGRFIENRRAMAG